MAERRSARWYGGEGRDAYIHRAWMRRGLPAHAFDGRPHIVIANTASDLSPCNAHFTEIAESVKQPSRCCTASTAALCGGSWLRAYYRARSTMCVRRSGPR